DGVHPAADALGHPPVTRRAAQRLVALDHLVSDRDHLFGLEVDVDAEVAQRAIEPLDVLLGAEEAPVEGARHAEAAVTPVEAPVAIGDDDVGLECEAAVEVGGAGPWQQGHGRASHRDTTPDAAVPPPLAVPTGACRAPAGTLA